MPVMQPNFNQLVQVWRDHLNVTHALYTREAQSELVCYCLGGLNGLEPEWKYEVERRRSLFDARWGGSLRDAKTMEEISLDDAWQFSLDLHAVDVAEAMVGVAGKVIRKTYAGIDQHWFDDPDAVFQMLIGEEVKFRQTHLIGWIYTRLSNTERGDDALMNLAAFVRNRISLSLSRDLLKALKLAGYTHMEEGLRHELQTEVLIHVQKPAYLAARSLRMMAGRANYGICKRLGQPKCEDIANEIEQISESVADPTFVDPCEQLLQDEETQQMFRDYAEQSRLTENEATAYYLKTVAGCTEGEIAERMGWKVGTIRKWHGRTRVKINKARNAQKINL